jgi:hypothetical protein
VSRRKKSSRASSASATSETSKPCCSRSPRARFDEGAQDLDLASGRPDQSQHHPNGRRLSRAVSLKKAVNLAALYRQVDAIDGTHVAVVCGQSLCSVHGTILTHA